jgi:hypothetical protein
MISTRWSEAVRVREARDRPLWRAGLMAAAAAGAVNGIIYTAAVAAGVFPTLRLARQGGPDMGIEAVLLMSTLGALGGIVVYALVRQYAANPIRAFAQVALAVLLVSFAGPFMVAGTTLAQGLVLNVMHVVTAAAVLAAVVRRH